MPRTSRDRLDEQLVQLRRRYELWPYVRVGTALLFALAAVVAIVVALT
jgi:hypothetical protein